MKWYSQAELDYAIAVARMQWYELGRWHSQDIKDKTIFYMLLTIGSITYISSIKKKMILNVYGKQLAKYCQIILNTKDNILCKEISLDLLKHYSIEWW